MTFKIGEIELPVDPGEIEAKFVADIKDVALLKQLPFLLPMGPKVPVLKLKGYIASTGKIATQLETDYLLPLRDMIYKPQAIPVCITDDGQASFWTWTSSGGSTANLTNNTAYKVKGVDCLKVDITWGAGNEGCIGHDYATAQNFLKQDFISFWLFGDNSSRLVKLRLGNTGVTIYFYYDVTVNWSGWRRLLIRRAEFSKVGSPVWSSIARVDYSINKSGSESGAVLYFDRHVVGVGHYVDGPGSRYDGIYMVRDFTWKETYRALNTFPYDLELWLEDDYY